MDGACELIDAPRSQTIYGGLVETSGPYFRTYTSGD